MSHLKINKHISAQFNAELEQAMNQVMAMGGLVEKQLIDALKAVNNHDKVLAQKVIEQDALVNQMEVDINDLCITVIAKRQPTASDLRLLIVIIKTINELERVGDIARRVCKTALNPSAHSEQFKPIQASLDSLAKRAIELFHQVLNSFARMDLAEAVRLYKENDRIEQEHEAIARQLMTYMMEDPRSIPEVLAFQKSAKSLEKIGARCQNLCEYIAYFVKGEDVRHRGEEAMTILLEDMDEG